LGCCALVEGDEYFDILKDMVEFKHEGKNITKIEFYKNMLSKTTLHMKVYIDDDDEGILTSWKDCARRTHTKDTSENNLICAMRNSIFAGAQAYKYKQKSICCADCKSTENIQVDHIIPFHRLKKDFLRKDLVIPTKFDFNGETGQPSFCVTDKKFRDEWIIYHDIHAIYQLLCATCNNKKSKKSVHLQTVSKYDNKDDVKKKKLIAHIKERIILTEAKLVKMNLALTNLE
jgi:5-methylcytosine-specific restriction endonuclease McrA